MTEMLFYIAGAAMMVGVFTLWCAISIERVRREYETSRYGVLCGRIQEQIDEVR